MVIAGEGRSNFELKYSYVDKDASDFTADGSAVSDMTWEEFVNNPWFKYIRYAVLVLFIMAVSFTLIFWLYNKQFN